MCGSNQSHSSKKELNLGAGMLSVMSRDSSLQFHANSKYVAHAIVT